MAWAVVDRRGKKGNKCLGRGASIAPIRSSCDSGRMSKHDLFSISCPGPHEKGIWCKKCNGDGIAAGGSDFKPVRAPKKSAWGK